MKSWTARPGTAGCQPGTTGSGAARVEARSGREGRGRGSGGDVGRLGRRNIRY